MIDIKLTKYGPMRRVEANGHAEYNPGNDIVCAGVSALFYAFAGYLKNKEDVRDVVIDLKSGNSKIEGWGDLKEAFDMLVIGIEQIAQTYPKNVRCTYIDKD